MEHIEIVVGNKLIAEFMGVDSHLSRYYYLPTFGHYCNSYGVIEYEETFREDELKYHLSWDWIMPVIFKCHDEGLHFDSQFTHCELRASCDGKEKLYYNTCNDYPEVIMLVYNAVITFIKWYNQNK